MVHMTKSGRNEYRTNECERDGKYAVHSYQPRRPKPMAIIGVTNIFRRNDADFAVFFVVFFLFCGNCSTIGNFFSPHMHPKCSVSYTHTLTVTLIHSHWLVYTLNWCKSHLDLNILLFVFNCPWDIVLFLSLSRYHIYHSLFFFLVVTQFAQKLLDSLTVVSLGCRKCTQADDDDQMETKQRKIKPEQGKQHRFHNNSW